MAMSIPCNATHTFFIGKKGVDLTGASAQMQFKLTPSTSADALITLTTANDDGLVVAQDARTIGGVEYLAVEVISGYISLERAALFENLQGYADVLVEIDGEVEVWGPIEWSSAIGITSWQTT